MSSDNRPVIDEPDYVRWKAGHEGEWEKLNPVEKSIMRTYRSKLLIDVPVTEMRELMTAVNDIHEKYPDFHVGCMPCIPIHISSFDEIPLDDQEVITSYREFKNQGIEDDRILGLAILAKRLMKKYSIPEQEVAS